MRLGLDENRIGHVLWSPQWRMPWHQAGEHHTRDLRFNQGGLHFSTVQSIRQDSLWRQSRAETAQTRISVPFSHKSMRFEWSSMSTAMRVWNRKMRIYSSLVLGSGVKNSRLASTCSCCFTASRLWRHCLLLGLAMCILIAGHSLLNHVLSFDAKFLGNDGSGSDRSLLKMARTTLPATSRQRYDFHQGKPVPSNNQQTDEDVKEGIHGTKDNKRIVHSNQTQPDTFLEQERFQQRRVEKIQQVCRRQGIVRNPPVFVLMENASRPSYLEDSTNRSG